VAFTEKIKVVIDVVADSASKSLSKFRTDVAAADTSVGKFKAGGAAAFDAVKANVGALAFAGGAALVTFGVKAVGAFNETAIGAGQLRDALGVTAEEASRLQEVAGDLGIGVEAVEKTIGRMNREVANSPQLFDDIGAAIARNEDGTTNVTETFLNTIDALNRIPDAAERAARAQEIFGKSWMDVAELVELGADDVRAALDGVEGGKIIDDKEVDRARKFRDTLDNLKGVAEELAVEVGGSLTEALNDVSPALIVAADATGKLARGLGGLFGLAETAGTKLGHILSPWNHDERQANQKIVDDFNAAEQAARDYYDESTRGATSIEQVRAKAEALGLDLHAVNTIVVEWAKLNEDATEAVDGHGEAMGNLDGATEDAGKKLDAAAGFLEGVSREADIAAREAGQLTRAWDELTGELSDRSAFLDVEDGWDGIKSAAEEAYIAAVNGASNAEGAARDHERAIIDQKQRVIDYGREVLNLPPEQLTNVLALIDRGKLAEAETALANLARPRNATITARTVGGLTRYHDGGVVAGPRGSEQVIIAKAGETVLPTHKGPAHGAASGAAAVGGAVVFSPTINVTAGMGVNGAAVGQQIMAEIAQHIRHNGPGGFRRMLGI
jgi:hypothetical protein